MSYASGVTLEPGTEKGLGRIWDFVALAAAIAAVVALFVQPWMASRSATYSALAVLLGTDDRRIDHALIFLPFLATALALLASLGAVLSPRDARHWKVFNLWAGSFGLFYFFNFFVNKDNDLDSLTLLGGETLLSGFQVFLLASLLLIFVGLVPRQFSREPALTRLNALLQNEKFWGSLYILPMLALVLAFTVYPVFESLRISTFNWKGIGEATQFVGLRHYRTVLSDDFFWGAFWNTIQYTVILVPVQLSLALILAVILDNPRMRLRGLYRTIYFLPVVTTLAIVAIMMRLLFQSMGDLNPISSPDTSMYAVIGFGIWYSFGINFVYFTAALQTVPSELYDAAAVDGANWFQRVWNITLPSIRPVAIIILFFAILGSLKVWEQSFALTGGGPFFSSEVMNGYIYRYAFGTGGVGGSTSTPNIGYASAAGFLMSMLVLAITLVQLGVNRFVLKRDSGPGAKT